ncbi:MAG: hypothetical protein WA160_07505 [Pseudobdellovibrio sp.]
MSRRGIVRRAGQRYSRTDAGQESHKKRQRKYRIGSENKKIETHPSTALLSNQVNDKAIRQKVVTIVAGKSYCCICLSECSVELGGLREYQVAWRR